MAVPEAVSAATVMGARAQGATVMGRRVQAATVMLAADGKAEGSLAAAAA